MCVYVRFYNTQFNVAKTCLSQDTFILSVMAVTKIIGIRFLVSALALNACVCIICKCTRVCCPRMLVWYIVYCYSWWSQQLTCMHYMQMLMQVYTNTQVLKILNRSHKIHVCVMCLHAWCLNSTVPYIYSNLDTYVHTCTTCQLILEIC